MSNTAIKVENLSKIYRLGEIGTGTISRDVERWFKTKVFNLEDPFLKIGETNERASKGNSNIVYSLRDLNFDIQQGDAVGIIGRNGAGKSTLLKILSRVTTPTSGKIKIKGRVASLLEVGTGFHPELTGRENIYLNGAILGMRKHEIGRKIDEIIDFSGVERYIDTPVKRYSSGMYVRLAFAVAAHLESEILIVDEVLAVGDAEFQKKCLGKMGEVSKGEGRTVLFVSHNMAAVSNLCNKALFIDKGELRLDGPTSYLIDQYLNLSSSIQSEIFFDELKKSKVSFLDARVTSINIGMQRTGIFEIGDDIEINFKMKFNNPNENNTKTSIEIRNADGIKILNCIDVDSNYQVQGRNGEILSFNVSFKDIRLIPDTYYISLYCGDMSSVECYDYKSDCLKFKILTGNKYTTRNLPKTASLFFLTPDWTQI